MKVLLVDDEDDIRKIGRLSLEAVGGFETVIATSGAQGVTLATATHPDVILLDVMMPEMDGLATFAALKHLAIPIVFLTARSDPEEERQYLAMGALGLIKKPFDPMTLPAQLLRLLG